MCFEILWFMLNRIPTDSACCSEACCNKLFYLCAFFAFLSSLGLFMLFRDEFICQKTDLCLVSYLYVIISCFMGQNGNTERSQTCATRSSRNQSTFLRNRHQSYLGTLRRFSRESWNADMQNWIILRDERKYHLTTWRCCCCLFIPFERKYSK